MKLSNEVRLILACARLRLEPDDRAEVQACLEAPLDWARVMRLARWHGLRPLLYRHLSEWAGGGVPRAALVECWAEAEAIARDNRAMRAELERILGALESAGIRALGYKGPTLAVRAYGDLALREFGDLDVLVERDEVQRARDLLCEKGYVREYDLEPAIERAYLDSRRQYHLVVRGRSTGRLVELHWKSDPDFPVERLDDDAWWEGTGRIDGLRTLPEDDLLLVLALHGSRHLWSSLGWLVDVAELLRSGCTVDWERIVARAESMRAGRRVGVGLRLAADLLRAPLPRACVELARRADVQRVAPAVAAAMLVREPERGSAWGTMRLHRALHEVWFHGIRDLFRAVCLPSLVEWTRWPLPRALFFAYPALRMGRLAGKYLRRGLERAFPGRKLQS